MASEIDPESEALIRQLHRELNGLTRASRRPPQQPNAYAGASARRELQRGRDRRVGSREPSGSKRCMSLDMSHSGTGGALSSRSDSQDQSESRSASPPARKRAKKECSEDEGDAHEAVGPRQLAKIASDKQSQGHAGRKHAPSVPHKSLSAGALPTEKAKSKPRQVPSAPHVTGLMPMAITPAAPQTALEAAALSASNSVREQVRAMAGKTRPSGMHVVKCHMAGVRWAIKLGPEALSTRSDLAAALNDAFEGQILSCGRGDMLTVLFMDGGGNESVFPSLRSTGLKESASRWKACAQSAVRVYVSRD